MDLSVPLGTGGKGLIFQATWRTQKLEEKLCYSLQNFFCGMGKAKYETEILNLYLLNTYYIPGHILGAGVRALNKRGKSLSPGGIGNKHLFLLSYF